MWDVADMLFSLRRQVGRFFSQPVNPAYWVMNIDTVAWKHPTVNEYSVQGVRLLARYPLLKYALPQWHWAMLESLYVLHQLDALQPTLPKLTIQVDAPLHWVDVGTKNGAYFPALCAVASTLNTNFNIIGVELDAYQFYEDGATRTGYAKGMVKALHPRVIFEESDFCTWQATHCQGGAQVVSCFLPFLHVSSHKAWGLPQQAFDPLKLFSCMWKAVAPGGVLLLSNLNAQEAAMQEELIHLWMKDEPDLTVHPILEVKALCHPTAFLKTREDTRFLWKLRKPLSAF
jgi:hypothetical protein